MTYQFIVAQLFFIMCTVAVAEQTNDELRTWYCLLAFLEEPLSLIMNLLYCSRKQGFVPFPFSSCVGGSPHT